MKENVYIVLCVVCTIRCFSLMIEQRGWGGEKELSPLFNTVGGVYHIEFSGDSRFLVWYGKKRGDEKPHNHTTGVFSVVDNRELVSLPTPQEVTAIASSRSKKYVAISFWSGTVELFDASTWKKLYNLGEMDPEKNIASGLAFDRDGKFLAAAYYPETGKVGSVVKLWNLADRRSAVIGKMRYSPDYFSFSQDNRFLAAGSFGGEIIVWDVAHLKEAWSFEAHTHPISDRRGVLGLGFLPGGSLLVSGGTDETIRLWDVVEKKEKRSFAGRVGEIKAMALSDHGKLVAVAGANKPGFFRIFQVSDGKQIAKVGPLGHVVSCIAFSPDGKYLAVGALGEEDPLKGALYLWKTSELIHK